MNYQAYIINLEHATDRWEHMRANLEGRSIPYIRIDGVYGKKLQPPIKGYNERKYHVLNGKVTNPGEVGCFFSHINALKTFLETDHPHALILEDDVTLPENIKELLDTALEYSNDWDLLRLTSSRTGQYLVFGSLPDGSEIAYNTRVLKNTGAYLINRFAAQQCIEKIMPMRLPYDEALDRDWDFGCRSACIIPFPVKLEEEMPSQIHRADRIRLYRSTTFHLFHTLTHVERIVHRKHYYRKQQQRQP
ncbi:MAG: hypothetical protein DRP64_00260 [Verrucomicrobia bacterium]|nr:MAG: hypothetical protein DRP64_00260 [Verrucomicrobiota bacterium]